MNATNLFGQAEESRSGFAHDNDPEGGKEEWLTPPHILRALGEFDLDPCSPIKRPWPTAKVHFTVEDNGLLKPWYGRVFCNPPYGPKTGAWLARCREHQNAIALIFARTETESFFEYVWGGATGICFLKGRLSFYHVSGRRGGSAGAPSVLIAWDEQNAALLLSGCLSGKIDGHYLSI